MEDPLHEVAPPGAPNVLKKKMMDKLANGAALPSKPVIREPTFFRSRYHKTGRRMPQAIAHRGDKAHYPENTLLAFKHAIKKGVHAIETDVHLTKDHVVVLSHDATLNRCYGVEKKIIDCNWEELKELRTIVEPHEPIARLKDLLEYVADPEFNRIWILLDIKLDNDAHDIIRYMSEAICSVQAPEDAPWEDRVLLGCWSAKGMEPCREYFPGFPITNIGFSVAYSRQFLSVENVSFNMLMASLVTPVGRCFIRDAKAKKRAVFAWTVNDEQMMDWCISRCLDGVITDDPKKYLDYCDEYDPAVQPPAIPMALIIQFIRINIFAWVFGLLFRYKHGYKPQNQKIKIRS